jgi:hypothetical protein
MCGVGERRDGLNGFLRQQLAVQCLVEVWLWVGFDIIQKRCDDRETEGER